MILGAAAIGAAITSCEPLDGLVVIEDYRSCVSYIYDHDTQTGYVDEGAHYEVNVDRTSQTFGVQCLDVRFYDGAPAQSAKVIGMNQYFSPDSSYVFMLQRNLSRSSGDFTIDSLRYGVVGNFWLTYLADNERYEVNVVPLKYNLETDVFRYQRTKAGEETGWHTTYVDKYIHVRYQATIDPSARTLSLKVNGQKYATGGRPYDYILPDIPLTFDVKGYTVHADKVAATDLKGNPLPEFDAYDLTGTFTTSFEGVKELKYRLSPYIGINGVDSARRVDITFYNHSMAEK